jgi:hypothetical protein
MEIIANKFMRTILFLSTDVTFYNPYNSLKLKENSRIDHQMKVIGKNSSH